MLGKYHSHTVWGTMVPGLVKILLGGEGGGWQISDSCLSTRLSLAVATPQGCSEACLCGHLVEANGSLFFALLRLDIFGLMKMLKP